MALKRKNVKGFSLLELLIVVAIIGILSLIVTPNFRLAKERAKVSAALADMKTIQLALETYRLDNGSLPPDIDGFIPFILTDPLSKPVSYLSDNRAMKDVLNDFKPKPRQWRFETYRYINIKGRLEGMLALNSRRDPSDWLPINQREWQEAHAQYGDYLIASTKINHKDNFKRDDAGRSKAMKKWNEFFWKDGEPKFLELKREPRISQKLTWSGLDHVDDDDREKSVRAKTSGAN